MPSTIIPLGVVLIPVMFPWQYSSIVKFTVSLFRSICKLPTRAYQDTAWTGVDSGMNDDEIKI